MTTSWLTYLSENHDRYVEELISFLRIPSISSLPQNAVDVNTAAQWVSERLQQAGIENVQILPTGGHPVVYGDWLHAGEKPTVMIYGHFDTQPVDPLELWSHPPFDPVIRDGRIYARGASDDKGNMLAPILAVEALLKQNGQLPINIKFMFEGQEKIGSPQLPEFVATHKKLLACDLVLSADGGQWQEDQPAIQNSLRGICALQIDIKGATSDVHSGTYGGTFMNPIQALTRLLASMHDTDGRIQVSGFYDDVIIPSDDVRANMAAVPYDETDYKKELGVAQLFGEPEFSTFERAWIRPTLEFNGIWGGFQEEGTKTVIPSEAHAKITCRLVPAQQPDTIADLIRRHVENHAPPQVRVHVEQQASKADPYVIPFDHPGNEAARSVHKALYGKEPLYPGMGGTIPICALLHKHLDAYTVNFAFGLKDENVHAPDEFFRLSSFARCQKAYGMILEELAASYKP